jgi:hypothetical protein
MKDPISAEYREMMNVLAEMIDTMFNGPGKPPKVGFVLLTTKFGQTSGGRVNYIGNGSREDMIVMMKEYVARAEGRVTGTEMKQ